MGFLINAVVLTSFMGGGTFFLLRFIKERFDLDLQESKGYFMLLMLVSTLLSAAIVYAGGVETQGEGSVTVSLGILMSVAISVVVLVVGLQKIQKIEI